MVGWIKMKLVIGVGLGPGHIVLDGDPTPLPQKGHSPQFWPMSVVAKRLDGSRCHLVWWSALARQHCVRWGPCSSSQNRGHGTPQFSADVYCGQTARWIKMPPGTEVNLGPGHIVLDGDPAPPPNGAQPPIFGPCLL